MGGWLSARQVGRVPETAEHLDTERFLHEKYALDRALPDDGSFSYAAS